ncbi:MAG: winged helix-turn-helix transcriptional regulator [Planctomycetales bacterium]|nr:winged helix-turn-helix transcriptional regulator [Planctomycetales bacterium]
MPNAPLHESSQIPPDWASTWLEVACELTRLARQAQSQLSAWRPSTEVSEIQILLLWRIAGQGAHGLGQSELVESVGMSKARISQQVEQLRLAGLISAGRPANDRRRQLWTCTPDGLRVVQFARQRLREHQSSICAWHGAIQHLVELAGHLDAPCELRVHDPEVRP